MRADAPKGLRPVLTMTEIRKLFPYTTSYIYKLIRTQRFPPSHKVRPDGRRVVWYEADIIAFQSGTWSPPELSIPKVNTVVNPKVGSTTHISDNKKNTRPRAKAA